MSVISIVAYFLREETSLSKIMIIANVINAYGWLEQVVNCFHNTILFQKLSIDHREALHPCLVLAFYEISVKIG